MHSVAAPAGGVNRDRRGGPPAYTAGPMREFDLLRYVFDTYRSRPGRVPVGPGDDMAVVRLGSTDLLLAVDQLVVGRHAAPGTPPASLGRKAVRRSLSDVAAMAAEPTAALAAVVLPPDIGREDAQKLFDGMREAAEENDCPLVGGDIAIHDDASHPLTCSVTVLAASGPGGPVLRSGAQVGDGVFVTGVLGGSVERDGGGHHLSFRPRIAEARQLARSLHGRLHAMIDVSDGLGRDASHLARPSGVRIEIDVERIPCRGGLPWRRAAADGEDYELLFTASGDVPVVLGTDVPVHGIGRVVAAAGDAGPDVLFRLGSETWSGDELGWEHQG